MPEGDTVFRIARNLDEALRGREVARFELRVASLALADLTGQRVDEVQCVGKHLLMRFGNGQSLHSHLRMDGGWRLTGPNDRAAHHHGVRALVGTADRLAIGMRVHDLALIATRDEASVVGHLGPDLLDPDFDRDEGLRRLHQHPDRTIGEALLDQRVIAGIGNVYKSELLFLHRLDPWLPVRSVPDPQALLDDAVRLLKANALRPSRSTTGWTRPGQQYYVYGRRGRPCPRCGTEVQQREQGPDAGERVVYFCPSCQQPS
ncbi:MAG TPA: DNA-formamidopyrimidine glycosylase family protein [Jatrophihabitans sp.]|jgi:endonuclease-8